MGVCGQEQHEEAISYAEEILSVSGLNRCNATKHTDRKADNCGRLWKIRSIFDTLNDDYENYSNSSEQLAADEIILQLNWRVVT